MSRRWRSTSQPSASETERGLACLASRMHCMGFAWQCVQVPCTCWSLSTIWIVIGVIRAAALSIHSLRID